MESSNLKKRFIRWMEENRGLILTVIGLPASFIFDTILRVNKKFDTYLNKLYFFDIYFTQVLTLNVFKYFTQELTLTMQLQTTAFQCMKS
jgi:hypothetical protein